MWQYRELIKNLTIADFKLRYQNTSHILQEVARR
jgi:ABC-type polysaccharide/polyol phosphate export permease